MLCLLKMLKAERALGHGTCKSKVQWPNRGGSLICKYIKWSRANELIKVYKRMVVPMPRSSIVLCICQCRHWPRAHLHGLALQRTFIFHRFTNAVQWIQDRFQHSSQLRQKRLLFQDVNKWVVKNQISEISVESKRLYFPNANIRLDR